MVRPGEKELFSSHFPGSVTSSLVFLEELWAWNSLLEGSPCVPVHQVCSAEQNQESCASSHPHRRPFLQGSSISVF